MDGDWDAIPNQYSALISKGVFGPLGKNRHAIWTDCFDLVPFFLAQLFLRASSL
jgi:hypothetical protein